MRWEKGGRRMVNEKGIREVMKEKERDESYLNNSRKSNQHSYSNNNPQSTGRIDPLQFLYFRVLLNYFLTPSPMWLQVHKKKYQSGVMLMLGIKKMYCRSCRYETLLYSGFGEYSSFFVSGAPII
jgi:hypothetical protein